MNLLTAAALCACAGNALLTRLALGQNDDRRRHILRASSGVWGRHAGAGHRDEAPDRVTAFRILAVCFALLLYVVPYSYGYLNLGAGIGALIFTGSVQVTMIGAALMDGERPAALQWLGFSFALAGLIYLLLPDLAAPPLVSSVAMILAGVARSNRHLEPAGVVVALLCGAVTSGLGYVLWYAAVQGQSSTRAAIVQLPVPILTGTGGVLFLGETLSHRLMLSAIIVLGGILLSLVNREQP